MHAAPHLAAMTEKVLVTRVSGLCVTPGTACPRHVIALVCIIGHEFLLPAPHLNLARTVNNKNWEAASMAPNSLN